MREEEEEKGAKLSLWGWSYHRVPRWHLGLGEACTWGPAPRSILSFLTKF